jgi:hypothetical protein
VTFFEDSGAPVDPTRLTLWWPDISDDLPDRFYDPVVRVDSLSVTADGLAVAGWALDRTDPEPVAVRFWVDGASEPALTLARADGDRPDVDTQFGLGADHGFDVVLASPDLTPGPHEVCAQAIGRRSRAGARPDSQSCAVVIVEDEHRDDGTEADGS